jgi:RNA polymerase sigma factor (sigma-70 family)
VHSLYRVDARAQAIETLYRERFAGYCNALATVTGDRESARDAVQEAFARALRDRRKLRREEALAPWVWTIAIRLANGTPRRRRSRVDEPGEPALPDPERDPELAAAVRSLSPRRRLIVFLRYFGDFSYAEIAEACEVSEGTVAATLAQAHDALRGALSAERTEGARR